MTNFKNFERKVVEALVKPHLQLEQLASILDAADFVSYDDYEGAGYFLTIHHTTLPLERIVCDKPWVIGKFKNVQCGFVVFLEQRELTLECYPWGLADIPANFRDQEVEVEVIQ